MNQSVLISIALAIRQSLDATQKSMLLGIFLSGRGMLGADQHLRE
ncbi:Unknown protein sequence [Pseudomonas syringae pv. cilantro]|uniref:Uncharacterized protein n=1 Tax=Pseudomonas syringae pv. cilantro TaxID=81035 RepID=A0A0N0GE12_PSESX|nr:Unknown protein sequence [Pseudomonas syringae pv. cilantro]